MFAYGRVGTWVKQSSEYFSCYFLKAVPPLLLNYIFETVIHFLFHKICQKPLLQLIQGLTAGRRACMGTSTIDVSKLPAAWEKRMHHLSFDHNTMMPEQNLEHEAASSDNPCPHVATLFMPKSKKDNSYMMKFWLRLLKNTEISALERSSSDLHGHIKISWIYCRWKCSLLSNIARFIFNVILPCSFSGLLGF